eukprot:GFUD01011634.1.p1 GENE.GFUD01011634.1~~GFUD01011634.1.p1  ORF type:complete len:407 (+),score=86.08 GFUD01011634.1:109-1221(+)
MEKTFSLLLDQHKALANRYESLLHKIETNSDMETEYASLLEEYETSRNKSKELLETFMVEKKKVDKEHKSICKESEEFKVKHEILLDESKIRQEESRVKYEVLERKHNSLVDKLHERIECPVCLEIPEAGPVFNCPNGHLVCSKCKSNSCPTCRSKMFEGKSLLAVTVLENIEHKCRNQKCDQLLPLAEISAHRKVCTCRLIKCPATLCEGKVAFCSMIDHLMTDCNHSYAKEDKKINDVTSQKGFFMQSFKVVKGKDYKTDTLLWNDKYFFLTITAKSYWTFHVEMLGEEEECSKFSYQLVLHKNKDIEANNYYVYRFTGKPCSVEEEKNSKRETGLNVSNIMMTKLSRQVMKDEKLNEFKISIAFYKI